MNLTPCGSNSSRLRILPAVFVFLGFVATPVLAREPVRRPRIRTVTAFVRIEPTTYRQQIAEAVTMLSRAKDAFQRGGYEVQTVRITTQPFPEYIGKRSAAAALEFLKALDDLAKNNGFLLNIGPLDPARSSDPSQVELLSQVLAKTRVNASLVVAGEDGVHWQSVRAAAQVIKYLENHSPNGVNNFGFAAVAMAPPNGPFFPSSHHDGPGHQFAVGWEAGSFVEDVLDGAHGNIERAKELLSREFERQAKAVDGIARKLETDLGWNYLGLDPTPAPGMDSSIGTAIEKLLGTKFGSRGTLSVAALITDAERSISVSRVGFAGLMLPVLEDPVLAQRWSEGSFDLDSLLAYSAVCGTGLDTIPLPGDVSQEQLERIIGDMASLAFKWHKALTARLVPAPGKKAGERTEFDFGVGTFPQATIRPLH